MKSNFLKKFVISTSLLLTVSSVTVFAATLMTYSGSNIRGKYSVNSFSPSRTQNINFYHENVAWNNVASSSQDMEIQVHRKNSIGLYSKTGLQFNKSGVGSTSQTYSLSSGTYKLYFHAPTSPAAATIEGSVSN